MIITIIFLTGLIAFGSKWIIVDDDFMKIIPNDVQSKIEWDKITNEFGNVDLMFIAFGRKGSSIFNDKVFSDLWDVTQSLENISSVDEIISLSNLNRIDNFDDFIEDGILEIENEKVNVFENGRLFTRNIAMKFDPLVKKNIGTYSKTI